MARWIVGCEYSGRMREALRRRGHDAYSCDLLPSRSPYHIQGDVLDYLDDGWDGGIFHPPCTYLANSGVRWLFGGKGQTRDPVRWQQMEEAAWFFLRLYHSKIPFVALENPIMHCYARAIVGIRPTQIVQPWQFGVREMKATGWWLRGLAPLRPTNIVGPPPKDPCERRRWARVHQTGPGEDRWMERSIVTRGIVEAAAEQWAGHA